MKNARFRWQNDWILTYGQDSIPPEILIWSRNQNGRVINLPPTDAPPIAIRRAWIYPRRSVLIFTMLKWMR